MKHLKEISSSCSHISLYQSKKQSKHLIDSKCDLTIWHINKKIIWKHTRILNIINFNIFKISDMRINISLLFWQSVAILTFMQFEIDKTLINFIFTDNVNFEKMFITLNFLLCVSSFYIIYIKIFWKSFLKFLLKT